MTIDPTVLPGLLLIAAEFIALAAVGYVVVCVALRQDDDLVALAQGLVVGLALWGLITNLVLYVVPGLAGAAVAWGVVLAIGAGLVWRTGHRIRPSPRLVAGFAVAFLALFWVALASRQVLTVADAHVHLGLAAALRSGAFPPELPWTPGAPAPYHYGEDLLRGLLAPPFGPDLAFMEEVLGTYVKASLILVVVTALLRRSSRLAVAVAAPLLLTTGAWTLGPAVSILQGPLPAGLPAPGLRASLLDIYWPSVGLPWASQQSALPDIWDPSFTLSYALAFVVLERAAQGGRRSWPTVLTLAGLVGFVGLLATTLAPVLLVLWAGLEAVAVRRAAGSGPMSRRAALRSGAGLALAAFLLVVGSRLLGILDGSAPSGLALGWNVYLGRWRLLGSFDPRPGGVAMLGVGPLAVAGLAALLARRDRLVVALAVGAGALLLAALPLTYAPYQEDLVRIEGHARNFALLALLLALSVRLASVPAARWRYAAGALLVGLVIWPTVVAPVRNLGLAIGQGVEVANASWPQDPRAWFEGRYPLRGLLPSDRIAAYIRDHSAVDARVFAPNTNSITFATGRPNASGFAGLLHLFPVEGPAYRDARNYLEPGAVRRLGFSYVHAPDAWVAGLPAHAIRRLNDPRLFELLVRDGAEALYRVRPAFLELDATPHPESFEALRQAVPASATVYMPSAFASEAGVRTARALFHTQLLSVIDPAALHLLTPWPGKPLDEQAPDLVIISARVEPWMFPPAGRHPIWWNDEIAVYAPTGAVEPIMPPRPEPEPPPISVTVSKARAANGRIAFAAAFSNHAPEQWTGQEWVVVAGDESPWAIPVKFESDRRTVVAAAWFPGQVAPRLRTATHTFVFDILAPSLSMRNASGALTTVAKSERVLGAGTWTLAVRLQHEWQPNHWREAAFIPVLRISVSEAGEVSYAVFEDVRSGSLP